MSQGAPIAFDFQVRGDLEAKTKIQGVGTSVTSLGSSADKVLPKVDSLGGALGNLSTSSDSASVSAEKIQRNYSSAALGLSATSASVASLYFQFDNLEKVQLRADTAAKNYTASQATLASSQATLNSLVAKGVDSGPQYEAAVLRLKSAQEQLAIAQQRVDITQGDVSEAQTNFALGIIPSVFAAITGVTSAMSALGISFDVTKLKAIFTGPPMLSLNGVLGGTSVTAGVASTGIRGLGLSLKALALNPFTIGLLAVSVAIELVATNAFGLRDAIDSFAKKVEEVFPVLKPVFDFFRTIANAIFPDTKQQTEQLNQTMNSQFNSMSKTVNTSTGEQVNALGGLSDQFVDTNAVGTQNMTNLASNVKTQSDNIVSAAERAREAMASIGASVPAPSAPASATPQPPALTQVSPNAAITAGGQIVGLGEYSSGGTYVAGALPSYIQQLGPTAGRDTRSGQIVQITNVIQLDGKEIARQTSKQSTANMLGMT